MKSGISLAIILLATTICSVGCSGSSRLAASEDKSSADEAGATQTTAKPLSDEDLKGRLETEVPGFKRTGGRVHAYQGLVSYYRRDEETKGGAKMDVQVSLGRSRGEPLSPEEVVKGRDAIMKVLPKAHKNDSNLRYDAFPIEFKNGKVGVLTHLQSYVTSDGGRSRLHSYEALYHDGVNRIHMKAYSSGKMADSLEQMDELLPRDEAVAAMKDIFAAFADALE